MHLWTLLMQTVLFIQHEEIPVAEDFDQSQASSVIFIVQLAEKGNEEEDSTDEESMFLLPSDPVLPGATDDDHDLLENRELPLLPVPSIPSVDCIHEVWKNIVSAKENESNPCPHWDSQVTQIQMWLTRHVLRSKQVIYQVRYGRVDV